MQNPSKLCVVLLTYNRLEYATTTIRCLLDNIVWDGELHVHIADDGSDSSYRDSLRDIVGGYSRVHSVGVSDSERRGYGANYNLATQRYHDFADLALVVEDDWQLMGPLDVNALAQDLTQPRQRFGCIRLGYLGFTQRLKGDVLSVSDHHYLLLDPSSDEPHVFAGHPRLETIEWERAAGPWPEGLDPGQTEMAVAQYVRRGIVWPMWLVKPVGDVFTHIGTERAR